jgi:hypothetical protein
LGDASDGATDRRAAARGLSGRTDPHACQSGLLRDGLLTLCEAHADDGVIGLARNARLSARLADVLTDAWIQ